MTAITDFVSYEAHGTVGVITVDSPPVNALSQGVRAGIKGGIEAAVADDSVNAIVLACAGRTFIAGADITEFGKPPQEPGLNEVISAMENSTKPVVAAIHGTALGGGLETALGCHYRVANAAAKVGLPEVKLGLLPGAGGTQRLPRVVGVPMALEMIAFGNPIGAKQALEVGLVDEVVEGDLTEGAIAFAKKVVVEGRPLVKISDQNDKLELAKKTPAIFGDFRKKNARKFRGFEAPENCIKAIEGAVNLPFPEGLVRERELFTELMSGEQAKAQQYFFFSERLANKIPDVPKDTPLIDINTAGIVGAGTMGGGIAMNFLQAGIPVTIVETTQEALDKGLGIIKANYAATVSKGRLSQATMDKNMSLLTGSTNLEDLKNVDIVIEAIFENMDVKKDIFGKLDKVCKQGAILATNTSTLDIDEIGEATSRPEYVIGLHFFSPANVMRLLEEVRTKKTSASVMATCMALAKRIGKVPAMVGVCDGFVGNRMLAQRGEQAAQLILEGAKLEDVDRVLFDFGFPMGPFAMSDLAGNDVGWRIRQGRGVTSPVADGICELGRFGQKTGDGYYHYEKGSRTPQPDPIVEEIIVKAARDAGINRRQVSDEEILKRCIYPMINEAAKILEEGIATRASDIDVIWVYGYGWPIYRGGPMRYADHIGLENIYNDMLKFKAEHGDEWTPAPLLEKLAKEGKGFKDL
ncbi:3-hydroxyacyl-CoA dehydrogenase NAD-binding domain-containing protein [Sneathiella sp.]|uniref:3-hydroxyacyl-CoA dehydrogenase NAD-binding domain-containing protein n=1 Tax=Sneathiella sp. TaxID=1964365 RepID=UPI00260E2F7A|nr:3-hydroxyacyl-CoA dehydrogenase NAD-binding domain-containing protein [Sneathiella sp.]MDF2367203.1 3-hydroxyacyl-CoA dehydrogenase NAD-binding domain-containing protein [Sneathiella sp.]